MTPAMQARINAGLTVQEAARRSRISAAYLRRIEQHGGASWVLACRLAALYQCRIDVFLSSMG
jgi:transcriptional regulator with XRE-family HTH domain